MRFRNLDSNDDWTFGRGANCYVSGDDAIKLNIKTRLYSWVGDCFFALTAGIDWVNRLGTKNQANLLDLELRRVILQSEGVTGLQSFNARLNVDNRDFIANYDIITENSQSFKDSITKSA